MRTPLSFLFLLITTMANAQNAAPSWLESTLYGNGKINVVVGVVAVIILGIGIWLWRMDRRISSLEKEKGA
ncbi:MAG: CcmD family protein [Flavobacteriales bacterium]|jgi:CcmD family protein|nr:CcmD family protein [Flavobacteriales bacterium]